MNAGGAISGVLPFVRNRSAGIALRFFACLVILFVSVISTTVTGGTQTGGGVTTSPATNGAAYLGGNGYHQGGGGGGGCFGGGGGYSVTGGAGGSSCVSLLTNGSTVAGDGTQPGASINSVASSPSTSTSPSCTSGAGKGGLTTSDSATRGGNGCVVIQYSLSGTTYYDTFNYTGFNQMWTVPTGVTSVIFHALGAGGGGGRGGTAGDGGGGGYATGQYSVAAGTAYSVIVGQGGKRQTYAESIALSGATARRNASFGGGAMFLAPKVIGKFASRLPNFAYLHRYLPRNLFRVVVMLFISMWWGVLVNNRYGESPNVILYAFVLLSIPGIALGVADWFARDSKEWPSTAVSKLLGVTVLIVGILCVRGVIF